MKFKDVKVGVLVTSADHPEISDKPGVVVGFIGNVNLDCVVNIAVVDDSGQMHCCCADQLEPVHYGCSLCKHAHKAYCDIPCAYCRCNVNLDSTGVRDKLPDFWEKDDLYTDNEPDDTYPISKDDSRLAAEVILKYADVLVACDEDTDPTELHELAKRIRNGVCE